MKALNNGYSLGSDVPQKVIMAMRHLNRANIPALLIVDYEQNLTHIGPEGTASKVTITVEVETLFDDEASRKIFSSVMEELYG